MKRRKMHRSNVDHKNDDEKSLKKSLAENFQ